MSPRTLWCCLCLSLVSTTVASAAITFVRPSGSTTVPMPGFMTTADFNRDGHADVAVASPQSSKIAILLGSTSGSLTVNTTYEVGNQLSDLAAGDVNGDGIADVVVADQRGAGLYILLGGGDGTFAPAHFVAAGHNPAAVAIADLDGRNGADLVVADRTENQALVLLNDGSASPTFTISGQYSVGLGPERVLLSDLNGDGALDIVTLNTGGTRVKDVSVVLFERMSSNLPVFTFLANFGVAEGPTLFAAADFNSDRKSDLAILDLPGGRDNGSIDLFLGIGNGFLERGPALAIACPVFTGDLTCHGRAFAAADFDDDGALDIAVTQIDPRAATSEDWLAIYQGIGEGMFIPGPVLGTDPVPNLVVAADITGDGLPDLVVGSDRARTVEVFVNGSSDTSADRLPGQSCDADLQCTTGLCRDTVCCRTECADEERCNLPSRLGTCTLADQERSRGEACDTAAQCASGFCVNQVCCIAGACPTGARCDIPPTPGVCSAPSAPGSPCEHTDHCRSGFCVDSFCCTDACPDGRCDSPGHEGICTGSTPDGQPCLSGSDCSSGVCDESAEICCAQRCGASERCSDDGRSCDVVTPTPSPSPTLSPSPTRPEPCAGDCDGNRTVSVGELVTGVSIALGHARLDTCIGLDTDSTGGVTVSELVAAVGSALRGCEN